MEITPQILLTIGLIVYYAVFQLYDDFIRSSTRTNSKSRILENLRSEYKVNIRTFLAKKPYGFASFKAIWINDAMFHRKEKSLLFVFHHEYYHLKHKHKQWLLLLRFMIALTPLTVYFVNWGVFVLIILLTSFCQNCIREKFEKRANEHAANMVKQ